MLKKAFEQSTQLSIY